MAFCFFTWFVAIYIWNASALSHILFASLPISLAFILLLLRMATVQRETVLHLNLFENDHNMMHDFIPFCLVLSTSAIFEMSVYVCNAVQWKESLTWNCNTINANVTVKMIEQCVCARNLFFHFFLFYFVQLFLRNKQKANKNHIQSITYYVMHK